MSEKFRNTFYWDLAYVDWRWFGGRNPAPDFGATLYRFYLNWDGIPGGATPLMLIRGMSQLATEVIGPGHNDYDPSRW